MSLLKREPRKALLRQLREQKQRHCRALRHISAREHCGDARCQLVQRFPNSSPRQLLKVSGIGADRAGIVYRIAAVIREHDGNIQLQRSMRVAGEFAITIIASFPPEQRDVVGTINSELHDSLGSEFVVTARAVTQSELIDQHQGAKYVIAVKGNDRIGIVEGMTLFLLKKQINIDAMQSEVTHRPFDGSPEFTSTFEITVPVDFDSHGFTSELEQVDVGGDLVISVEMVSPLQEFNSNA